MRWWWLWGCTHDCAGRAVGLGPQVETRPRGLISCVPLETEMQRNGTSWFAGADEVVVVMGVHM